MHGKMNGSVTPKTRLVQARPSWSFPTVRNVPSLIAQVRGFCAMVEQAQSKIGPYTKILLGFDGSENSNRALGRAIMVAEATSAELSVVVAADTLSYQSRYMTRYFSELRGETLRYADELVAKAVGTAKAAGVRTVHGYAEEGSPAEIVLAKASETGADLIIVGRRGIRGIQRFLMGGVSSSIVDHASCDVLVVK